MKLMMIIMMTLITNNKVNFNNDINDRFKIMVSPAGLFNTSCDDKYDDIMMIIAMVMINIVYGLTCLLIMIMKI